jgi:3-methyladenine DNA glycosylase/8-oxoguanine DNA glycosylase
VRDLVERFTISPRGRYALGPTLCCGQTFRFRSCEGAYQGACGDLAFVVSEDNGTLDVSCPAGCGDVERAVAFLDADHSSTDDAAESCDFLVTRYPDRRSLIEAVFDYSDGVHILRQPIVETVVGYLLSVQSTVSLIGARLEAMARLFPSNARVVEGRQLRLFPTVSQLKPLPQETIDALRLGYRTRWVADLLARMPDERGLEELRSLTSSKRQLYFQSYVGIGPKVAACIDLFAYQGDSAFPVDTWVDRGLRRVLGLTSREIRFARDHAAAQLGPHCGLFGEYLFRFERDHQSTSASARAHREVA